MMLLHFFLKTEKYNDEGEFAYTPTEHGPVAVAAKHGTCASTTLPYTSFTYKIPSRTVYYSSRSSKDQRGKEEKKPESAAVHVIKEQKLNTKVNHRKATWRPAHTALERCCPLVGIDHWSRIMAPRVLI